MIEKAEIIAVLNRIGTLLELQGENPFKVRAYYAGARALEQLEENLDELIAQERLQTIKGIGKALVEKIVTLRQGGQLAFFEELEASIPAGLLELLDIPGLGAKKVKILYQQLGISSIAALTAACKAGKVAALAGFGERSQEKILHGIANREKYMSRHLWWDANAVAQPILAGLRALPSVERAEVAGSLRRCLETVGDLDFIVAATNPESIMAWFTQWPEVAEVTARGSTKSSIRLQSGMQADLRVVPPEQFFFALHHFTGSKDHNVLMRQRALAQGYSLSEWGLRPEQQRDGSRKAVGMTINSEAELFEGLGLPYIVPELREGTDELARAEQGTLPQLLEARDIRGVFHNHTTASDGQDALEAMAAKALALGWEYLGIADHSQASFQANGLNEARLRQQISAIAALNTSRQFPVHIFTGVECDILPQGDLDLNDDILAALDYVVVSVHSAFSQSETEMTRRIIRAVEHPATTMLGHMTGRLLLRREPYAVNIRKVIDAAAAHNVIIELNAHPKRLDLDWRHWRYAAEREVLCSINPDAHSATGLECYIAGVNIARKGALSASQVFNTWPLEQVTKYFNNRRQR